MDLGPLGENRVRHDSPKPKRSWPSISSRLPLIGVVTKYIVKYIFMQAETSGSQGITIFLDTGESINFDRLPTGFEILKKIENPSKKSILCVEVNGVVKDLRGKIPDRAKVKFLTFTDTPGRDLFWHSSAHLLAQAIKRLYPQAKPTIGPVIEGGFFYDFADLQVTTDDFSLIEEEIKKVIAQNFPIQRIEYQTKEEAIKVFGDNPFKLELINSFEEGLSAYEQGDFIDLCRGPHVASTGIIRAVKLTKLSGAYWRGNTNNPQLTRIYGVSFPTAEELKNHLEILAEAEKRDHRQLGRRLRLYDFHEYSPGSAFFLPKGATIYHELMTFIREQYFLRGYQEVVTPQIFNKKLWETSGHWEHYHGNVFQLDIEGQTFALKPMNCPGHCLLYKMDRYSYRELPLRIADCGVLHRNETSGALSGLTRVRKFCQDDSHIFLTPEQIGTEVSALIEFADFIYQQTFDFDYHINLATRPESFLGDLETWNRAEAQLKTSLEATGKPWKLREGDGAFYGPKIDFDIRDALGREWQTVTIQLDFQLPARFHLRYTSEDGSEKQPVMIHRAIFGSFERFIALVTEHYAGKFPLWLNPIQARVIPVSSAHQEYAHQVTKRLRAALLRADLDDSNETLNKKIRNAQLEYVNYILVAGNREIASDSVTVRTRDNVVHGEKKVEEVVSLLKQEHETRDHQSVLIEEK